MPLGRYLLNTLIYTVLTTAVMLIVATLAAFAFARLSFRGKDLAFTLFLIFRRRVMAGVAKGGTKG